MTLIARFLIFFFLVSNYYHKNNDDDLYRKAGEPAKAEAFLCDAIKLYSQEGWTRLAHGTLRELAACQKLIGEKSR